MPPSLITGIVATVIAYSMLMLTGINGIRHARLLKIGFDGYAMASIWLWIAGMGSIGLVLGLIKVSKVGLPVAIVYASGVYEVYSLGYRQWLNLVIWMIICSWLCFRSFVMVKRAKTEIAKTNKAMNSLRQTIEAGRAGG